MIFRRIIRILFANAYLRPFEETPFFRMYGPFFKPWVQRVVRNEYLQAWTLMFLVWGVAVASLPFISFMISMTVNLLIDSAILPMALVTPVSILGNGLIGSLQIWGVYYVTRLHLTKLFYWHRDKYPAWPTRSIWYQMDRYVFRPEVFALVLVTFLWLQLDHFLTANALRSINAIGLQGNLEFWLPWVGGALWPMVSIFFHRRVLEL